MAIGEQVWHLLILALAVATVAWTVTHEELFREPREWCKRRSENCNRLVERKFFYLFTCEYCFSYYVAFAVLVLSRFKLLFFDWRGYVLAELALVWIANIYMNIYARLRLNIRHERLDIEKQEKIIKNNSDDQVGEKEEPR